MARSRSIVAISSRYSSTTFSRSRPVRRCRRMSRIACACTSESAKRDIRFSRASPGVGAGADRRDHLVEMVERLEDAFEDVGALLGLAQVVAGAADDDRLAVVEEVVEQLLERHHLRLVVDDRQQDDAEGGLHLGHLVELVEDDLRRSRRASARSRCGCLAVGLVAQVGDPLDLLLADQLGDPLDQPRLVHLVGDLGDDDRLRARRLSLVSISARARSWMMPRPVV